MSFQFLSRAQACTVLVLFSLVVYSLYLKARRWTFIRQHGCKPLPCLRQFDHILGLDTIACAYSRFQAHSLLRLSQERFETTGNTFQFRQLWGKVINTIEPENIKAVLSTNFRDYSVGGARTTTWTPLLGHGILTADGTAWSRSRKIIKPIFSSHNRQDISTIFEPHVKRLISQIPADHVTVDVQEIFMEMTTGVSTEFLFGQRSPETRSRESSPLREFSQAFSRAQKYVGIKSPLGLIGRMLFDQGFQRDCEVIHQYMDRLIELDQDIRFKSKRKGAKAGLISYFSKQVQDQELLRGGLSHVLLAGRDTTGALISNLWFVIGRRPDIWRKLQAEITVLGGRLPTAEDLKSFKYLRNCLSETLRLYPPIPIDNRTTIRDTKLPRGGGSDGLSPVFVPAGTTVGYHVYSMHRRKDIFGPDADEFVPERWYRKDLRPGWGFLPFNGGPRVCIGQQFALQEVSYVTVRLCQEFQSVESRDGREWIEEGGLTWSNGNGTWLSFERRKQLHKSGPRTSPRRVNTCP